jgi:outer membrane protein assembly complex protein YaeT
MRGLLLALVVSFSPAAEDAPSLEGERLSSVRIEAAPAEVRRLEQYIEMRAGERLRTAAVRHAVELFHATGDYEDVLVEARRGPAGVDLVFRPVPAPLLSEVRVAGASVLSSADVVKIARLRAREPLWPARLEEAAKDVALALALRGYLEAQVRASAARRGSVADAVFDLRPGPLVRVGTPAVEGAAGAAERLLRERIRPRPGEVFRRPTVTEAADRMRRDLVKGGRWRARVEVLETYDPGAARMGVVFRVSPGPRSRVEVRGAPLPGGLREALEERLSEGALASDALEQGRELLEDHFRRRGHREVAVSHREETGPDSASVIYDVDRGAPTHALSVAVPGFSDLEPLLETRPGQPLQDRVVEEDVRTLTRALEDRGYAQAKVEPEIPEVAGGVAVTFRVEAGTLTTVASFAVRSPEPLPTGAALKELRIREGEPYRVLDVARDRDSVLAAYRNAGHLQVEVVPEVSAAEQPGQVQVVLRVLPGPRTHVDHIVIAGLQATREEVVRRELALEEGGALGLQKLLESQRRLGALGIFQKVSLGEMDPESATARSVVVTAEEAPRTTVAYGIGYAERDRLRFSTEATRRNLFGLDRSLTTFARISFRGSRLLATFREPYLFGHRHELFVTAFREEEDRDSFDFVRYGGLLQTARTLSRAWSLILRYAYQETTIFNIEVPLDEVDRQFRSTTFSGPSASVVNDTRDDPLDPRRGRFIGADIQLSHAALGGDSFLKGFLQAATYQRLTARTVLAVSGRLGLGRTFGFDQPLRLPLPDRFFAGGDYSLRGFAVDRAGPLVLSPSGKLVPTGGNGLLLGGAELRYDAGRRLSAAAFTEAGNVYPLVSEITLGDVRYTAGLGLRYKSALGPLRVDWGYKLDRRPGEKPYHVHLTIGHAF